MKSLILSLFICCVAGCITEESVERGDSSDHLLAEGDTRISANELPGTDDEENVENVEDVAQDAVPASGAVPAPAPAPEAGIASESIAANDEVSTEGTVFPSDSNTAAPLGVCIFYTKGDYVHKSSSAFEASGHGWWVNGNCSATWAVVTVQLQQFYSDGTWRNVGTVGKQTVRSGGGAGNRATGRAGCNSSSLTGWRSVIDVDLVGLADDPNKLVTPAQNIYCRR